VTLKAHADGCISKNVQIQPIDVGVQILSEELRLKLKENVNEPLI
jgi:hypothetical protein